ncbi:MAG: LacI family DNA-binding transcriptional regulator [Anaerolineae bacterium]
MAEKPVTIRDVARAAGVSPGTVSRAINDSPLVNPETRERIMQVVEELDYRPHLGARRLSTGRTLTIKVFVPFFTRPSVSERLRGAVQALAETQYDLVIHNVATPAQRERCFEALPLRGEADGALVISLMPTEEEAEKLATAEIPYVFIDVNHPDLDRFSQIYVDDVAGGRQATAHLLALGHRRIGFIGDRIDNPFNFTSSRDRYWGYLEALEEAGVPARDAYYAEDEHGRVEAQRQARQMLEQPEPPTAIFAASDTQAVGVLQAAESLGLAVPGDLSVIGYDDIELAEMMALTTVRQLLFESGNRGVNLLLAALDGAQDEPERIALPTTIVRRATTAPPLSTSA